uniref:Uncharacterized protein n=1 Tax=Arion vulgaris TaxID=1028688 RepID=A0A0B7BUZ7_9EUPU
MWVHQPTYLPLFVTFYDMSEEILVLFFATSITTQETHSNTQYKMSLLPNML